MGSDKMKKKIDKNGVKILKMFDIEFFGRDKHFLLKMIDGWLASKNKKKWIATVNPEFVMKASKDRHFLHILKKTDLNIIDGIGLIWAAKYLEKRRMEVIPGSDLINDLCKMAENKGYSVYFLGGWKDRAKRTGLYFNKLYPKLKIAGYYAGKCVGEDDIILKKIGSKRVDILFVAYGMKTQEEWIERNLRWLNVGVVMGVGRSFDYYSGDLKRAPKVWRKLKLEWLYSLIQEPKRWRRQLELPKFVLKVLFRVPNRV